MSGSSPAKTPGPLKVPFDSHSREPDNVARHFRYFGEVEAPKMDSLVYADYCAGVAEDPALLELACSRNPTRTGVGSPGAEMTDLRMSKDARGASSRL